MSTLITAAIPCGEFALSETLERVPEATFECEKIVDTAEGTVMPLVWARAPDLEELQAALEADSTIESLDLLSEFDEERLYRMEWVDHIELIMEMIMHEEAAILDASTEQGTWVLRVLYPASDGPSETLEYCENNGLTMDVISVRELDADPSGPYGLTESQYEALTAATEQGYYDVPRDVDLDDLADELGISHQALSERLRRGVNALVTDTLLLEKLAHDNEAPDSPGR